MINDLMYKSINKVLKVVSELREMSLEDLKDICLQYGESVNSEDKETLINIVLSNELSAQEMSAYQTYLNYYYFSVFQEQMDSLSKLDESVDSIQKLYSEKKEIGDRRRRASDKEKNIDFALRGELPLVRLNIEYSHAQSGFKDYISVKTKTGMKLAEISDELEEKKSRNLLYRFLRKGKIEQLEKKEHRYRNESLLKVDGAYSKYVKLMEAYGDYLRLSFYKLLDNRMIAHSVSSYRNLTNNPKDVRFYDLANIEDVKFSQEEKEEIFKDFLEDAHFDPEVDITGEIFYEAVRKYVTKYYTIMQARYAIRENNIVSIIREIVGKQRELVDGMKRNQSVYGISNPDDMDTMSLIYQDNNRSKK